MMREHAPPPVKTQQIGVTPSVLDAIPSTTKQQTRHVMTTDTLDRTDMSRHTRKLRPYGVHFADQGRSRESSPEGYPWPLSLTAETADPATLKSILKARAGGRTSTSRDVASS
jgi:hypothetical protein